MRIAEPPAYFVYGFNRYIVECKSRNIIGIISDHTDLIDT